MAQEESSLDTPEPKQALTQCRIIWAAMVGGVVVLVLVVMIVSDGGAPFPPDDFEIAAHERSMRYLLTVGLGISITLPALAIFVRGQVFKAGWIGPLVQPRSYLVGNLIAWALCEGVALYGLVVVMLGGSFWPHGIVPAVGLAGLLALWPNGRAMFPPRDPYTTVGPR